MIAKTYQKLIRISPRKLKLIADSIKGIALPEMENVLRFMDKKAAKIMAKVVKQAISNAKSKDPDLKKWGVETIEVLKGPVLKRWQAVSRGRAHSIMKRTSHLRIVLKLKEKKTEEKLKPASEKKEARVEIPFKNKIKNNKPLVKKPKRKISKKTSQKEKKNGPKS